MPKDLFSRYVWLVDTIRRYGKISRNELNSLWRRTPFSNGNDLARRTFFNYREAVEEIFNINIECDASTFEYYISESGDHDRSVTNWLLNSASLNDTLSASRDVADRIFLEDVPSAREHLSTVVNALKSNHRLRFTYCPYYRSKASSGIVIDPYFLKIFRQRWYITGLNLHDGKIKTYALDRMGDVVMLQDVFTMPADFDVESYSQYSFGIIFSHGEVKDIMIRANSQQAKYLRTLPLHHTQNEMVHDEYSMFTYRMRLTPDLVKELLSFGPNVTVISPPELRAMVTEQLKATLDNYMT